MPAPLVLTDRAVDLDRGTVDPGDPELRLTTKEIQLLAYLASRPREVVSRELLLAEVWGYQPQAQTRAVDNMMRKLRIKVEPDPAQPVHLVTVFGEGYRFDPVALAPMASPRATNLTEPLVPEVGRRPLVEQLRAWLADGRRCLTLVGPAGMGKSTVARRVALEEAERRSGGAWWCPVDEVADVPELRRRVSEALGATDAGFDRAMVACGPLLVILDGCDQLGSAAEAEVEAWLARVPALDVLTTSRRRPLARVGTVVEVPPLPRDAALELLEAQALRVRPGRPLPPAESAALVDILEGWPLAIELAAARLRVLSAEELSGRLAVGLDTTLETALQSSIEALDPVDQRVLARCAVFHGAFGAADAEAVCAAPDAVDSLHRLVDHSLLRAVPDGRLQFLDAIRALAADRLGDEVETVRRRHLQRFEALAVEATRPPVQRRRARIRAQWDDLVAAHRFALEVAPDSAARIVFAAQRELGRRGHHHHRLQLLRLTLAAGPSPELALAVRLALLNARAIIGEDVGDEHAALVVEAEATGDPELRATTLVSLAQIVRRRARPAEAEAICRRALDVAAAVENPYVHAWGGLALAGALLDQGRFVDAGEAYAEAGRIARDADDHETEGQVLWGLGLMELHGGRPADAEPFLRLALERCPDEPRVRMDAELALCQVAVDLGEVGLARQLHEGGRAAVLRFGDLEREAIVHSVAAELAVHDRDWDAAEAACRRHVELCRDLPHHVTYAGSNLGVLFRLTGRNRQALDELLAARDRARADGTWRVVARIGPELAAIRADLDDPDGAEAELGADSGADPGAVAIARAHIALARARTGGEPWLAEARAIRAEVSARPIRSLSLQAAIRRLAEVLVATERR